MLQDWSDKFELGIDEIDAQHKKFFDATHRLYDDILNVRGEHAVEESLVFLRNYAIEHFKTEEAFIQKHGYPRVDEHKQLHVDFIEKLDGLVDEFDIYQAPTQGMADQILELTQGWLTDHIIDEDTLYAEHVRAQS
jgi:hemerythrin